MNWLDIVSARKEIDDAGKWSTGQIPRSAFPLSKSGNKAYRPGNKFWRAMRFFAGPCECRLLITFSAPLEQFQALLGVVENNDMKVVAALEYHGTHEGWHLHVREGDLSTISPGFKRGPDMVRRQPPPDFTRTIFDLDTQQAYKVTVDYFRLDKTTNGDGFGVEP